MLKGFCSALFGLVLLASAAAQPPLRVAAAADLEPVLPPILLQFQQATGITTEATYQSSAMLATQILNGAPFDLFLSADLGFPQRIVAAGAALEKTPTIYAKGTLVLWERNHSGLPAPSLELLHNPRLQRLAIASPERAPYGRAALASLRKLGLYEALRPRLVTAENIAQAAQFADSGNADAGLISLTAALKLQASGRYFVLPRDLYPPIEQGAVVVSRSSRQDAARKLLAYLLSPPVQAELAKGGLTPVR